MIALFAPCCISVMLPAYFASSFHNRNVLIAMTFVFAAGIATVILPLTMGASVLRQIFIEGHKPIYITGGLLLLGLAAYTLLGGQIHLPMPGRRAGGKTGPLSIYSLGVFSGVASSCCAPVLAGVIALSGVASSFGLALGLGAAYVFGMVAPLFVIALLWERCDWRASRLFRPRSFTWQVASLQRTLSVTSIASGAPTSCTRRTRSTSAAAEFSRSSPARPMRSLGRLCRSRCLGLPFRTESWSRT